ncbi:hypothetical protein QFC20_007812 [Naganishia adeliensis]|uniref:Uncharacterized protein n=1 Tax=Naganishia adeliensis TaxID=92952 RepID=A0ACC2UV68_9TREE|nr:hypothetical protein QFC20_007812 [Naganishia adeliensis]
MTFKVSHHSFLLSMAFSMPETLMIDSETPMTDDESHVTVPITDSVVPPSVTITSTKGRTREYGRALTGSSSRRGSRPRSPRPSARSLKSGYRSNTAWDMAHEVRRKIDALEEALCEGIPEGEDRAKVGYGTLKALRKGLIQTQISFRHNPFEEEWRDGMVQVQTYMETLDAAWTEGGAAGSEIVQNRWPGIRNDLLAMQDLLREATIPAGSEVAEGCGDRIPTRTGCSFLGPGRWRKQ